MASAFLTAALASVPPKRGFVADTRNGTCADAQLLSAGTSWYYDYNGKPRQSTPPPCEAASECMQLSRLSRRPVPLR